MPSRHVIPVPFVHQATKGSCGPAATLAVAHYWLGSTCPWKHERDLSRALRANRYGVEPSRIAAALRKAGLDAELRTKATLQELDGWINGGVPVILGIQAWPEHPVKSWANVTTDGHYVIAVGRDDSGRVVVVDPVFLQHHGWLPLAEFHARWRFPLSTGIARGVAIPVRGEHPAYPMMPERVR